MNLHATTQSEHYSELEVTRYLKGKVDEAVASRAVQHPFLAWYGLNALSKDQERILFSECFYWFRYLPFYIASMSSLTRDERIFREIMFNVADEMCGPQTHAQIYLEFLDAIGIRRDDVLAYTPAAETVALNSGMGRLYGTPPLEKALGALFFDEVMSAIMVDKVANGLLNQGYDEVTARFWILHIEAEKGHSNSVNNAFSPLASEPGARRLLEEGFYELMSLVEAFWDRIDALVRHPTEVIPVTNNVRMDVLGGVRVLSTAARC
jgi:pyrroloquinoline-quinone synthase